MAIITCPLCAAGKMQPSTAQLFTDPFVRFCGAVFVVPTILGVFSAFYYLFSGGGAFLNRINLFSGMIVFSMISGILGWLLLSKRLAWKCPNCGHYQPRQ